MKIYLSSYYFDYLAKDDLINFLKICLLFHEKIILPFEISNFEWTEQDKSIAVNQFNQKEKYFKNVQIVKELKVNYLHHFALKHYLDYNPIIFYNILNKIESLYTLEKFDKFYHETLIKPKQYLGQDKNIAFSATLLLEIIEVFKKIKKKLDYQDERDAINLHFELFYFAFLNTNLKTPFIPSAGQMRIIQELKKRPNKNLWDSQNGMKKTVYKFMKFRTVHGLINQLGFKQKALRNIGELVIPDINEVPLVEISKFVAKSKEIPIVDYITKIVAKYDDITEKDMQYELMSYYRKIANILSPNLKDITVGVIGNFPSPILVNPIGLFGLGKQISDYNKINKEYQFFIRINEINKMKIKNTLHNKSYI